MFFDNSFSCSKKFKIVDFKSRLGLVRQCWNVDINLSSTWTFKCVVHLCACVHLHKVIQTEDTHGI